jgi:hypothetical protein
MGRLKESLWDYVLYDREFKQIGRGGYFARTARQVCNSVAENECLMHRIRKYKIKNGRIPNSPNTLFMITVKKANTDEINVSDYTVQRL